MDSLTAQLFRVDPLTGCHNFLSFVERLDQFTTTTPRAPFSLLTVDMNYFSTLNETKGHAFGDSILRWLELVLREESQARTYRIGGDEFALILTEGTPQKYENILNKIFSRLNKEAQPLGFPDNAASIGLLRFDEDSAVTPRDILIYMDEAIADIKRNRGKGIYIYSEHDFAQASLSNNTRDEKGIAYVDSLKEVSHRLVNRLLNMGQLLDEAQQAAYTDSTSGLPNLRAAMHKLEQTLANAKLSDESFSVVLIDGDNLRLYNNISYAVGDAMIQRMSEILSQRLRPGDFIARWRFGDEFIAILPGTPKMGAQVVGNRFRTAIKEISQAWEYPTSISVGIAIYPNHGTNIKMLLDQAESALKQAKNQGKDQVVVADFG